MRGLPTAAIAPVVAGLIAFLNPLHEKRRETVMTLVTKLAVLPESGAPRRFTIEADRVDGWTTHVNSPIGSVYLRRTGDDGVAALNVVCPHADCFVGVADDERSFACPCHGSSFNLDGTIADPSSPSPRRMDVLEVEIRNGDEILGASSEFPARCITQDGARMRGLLDICYFSLLARPSRAI